MPYVKVAPSVYLEHNGVEIFHVYRDGTDEPWSYWFTTDPETADHCYGHGEGGHFDARMFVRLWESTPTVAQWDGWWKPRFKHDDDAVAALIRSEIEAGRLAISRPHHSIPSPTGEVK